MTVGAVLQADGAGRDLVAADIALGAGFGTTPVLEIAAGSNRSRGTLNITCDATAAADATVTITFPEAFDVAPVAIAARGDADQAAGELRCVTTTTTLVITFEGTPVDTEEYIYNYIVVG